MGFPNPADIIHKVEHAITGGVSKLKDLASKSVHEVERATQDGAHDIEKTAQQGVHDIEEAAQKAGHGLQDVAHGLEGDALQILVGVEKAGLGVILNQAVDFCQEKFVKGKVFKIKIFWFTFDVHADSAIDTLQAAANDPPTGRAEIVQLVKDLVHGDEVEIRPSIPVAGAIGPFKVSVDQFDEWAERELKKIGL